jgi:hypothetical protein
MYDSAHTTTGFATNSTGHARPSTAWRRLRRIVTEFVIRFGAFLPRCSDEVSLQTSDDPNVPHHPGLLMFDDVAMEHPIAGFIGHKSDLGLFFGQ